MKILFMTRHFGCLRNYEEAIHALIARGHSVHLVALVEEAFGADVMVAGWAAAQPAMTYELLNESRVPGPWDALTPRVRMMLDYLRYLEPAYRAAPRLEERARRRTPQGILRILTWPGMRSKPARRLLTWGLRTIERAAPRSPEIESFLRRHNPDVALFTPLIGLGSEETDYLDATRPLGCRAVFCVWSWDNLSSKALLRTMPDLITVWNDTQRREAVELHDAPADRVCVTGAQAFDRWFDRAPTRTREEFCARVGLPDASPFLLWVCSALIKGSDPEAPFVRTWIEAIRASEDPALRNVNILVRPHPSRLKEWESVSLEGLGGVGFWGRNPIDADARADYFDSLHYSTAVVGLNTSAFIEAAIAGKPVYTVLLPQFYENQEGTLHFHYLLTLEGGLLQAQRSMPAHLEDLSQALGAPMEASARSRRFVEQFVRPHGVSVSGTDRFIEAVEALGNRPPPAPMGPPFWLPWLRRLLQPMAERAAAGRLDDWLLSPQEALRNERLRQSRLAKDAVHHQHRQTKQQKMEEHRARKARERAERQQLDPGKETP